MCKKINIGLIVLFSVLIGYQVFPHVYKKDLDTIPQTQITTQAQNEVATYSTNIPLEYFDYDTDLPSEEVFLDSVKVSELPVMIESPDLSENVNIDFTEIDTKMIEYPAKYLDPVDTDNDGKEEQIYYVPVAMNHGAAEVWIIKNGSVVFKSEGSSNRWFEATKYGNGFYLTSGSTIQDKLPWNVVTTRTRYIYKDNQYVPVWYQKIYSVKVERQV